MQILKMYARVNLFLKCLSSLLKYICSIFFKEFRKYTSGWHWTNFCTFCMWSRSSLKCNTTNLLYQITFQYPHAPYLKIDKVKSIYNNGNTVKNCVIFFFLFEFLDGCKSQNLQLSCCKFFIYIQPVNSKLTTWQ